MSTYLALGAGALAGLGVSVVGAALVPARPDLASAYRRFQARDDLHPRAALPTGGGASGWVREVGLPMAADRLGLHRYAADLRLLARSGDRLAAAKIGYALLGLLFPPTLAGLLLLVGVHPPGLLPVALGVVLGGALFLVPDVTLRRDAAAARAGLRRATAAYIDLVALERLSDAGTSEALDRAAAVGQCPEFNRIRDALVRAELAGRPSWAGLADLAQQTGVVELDDLADIMAVARQDGAAVYTTLRARAASLRTQLLTAAAADANAASEHMVVPVSLLGVCFMALLAYPAIVQIMFG